MSKRSELRQFFYQEKFSKNPTSKRCFEFPFPITDYSWRNQLYFKMLYILDYRLFPSQFMISCMDTYSSVLGVHMKHCIVEEVLSNLLNTLNCIHRNRMPQSIFGINY